MAKWHYAAAVALGLIAGSGSALVWMREGLAEVGEGWQGSRYAGSVDADAWTRANVALTGLMALKRSQAIYFIRTSDDSGARLDESCRYRVAGGALPGRWWSVTVYAPGGVLPRNGDHALSFDATRVHPDGAGHWQAIVAPAPQPGVAWASSRGAGRFDLTLRIYNPNTAAQADFPMISLPHVTRIDCAAGAR